MFHYIKGPLTYKDSVYAVIEAGGVGYKMAISQTTFNALPPLGTNDVKLFTHLSVREDGIELFGFYSQEELSAFKMLISVSGVGPKVAVSILSFLSPEKFILAVSSEDAKTLSKASGVGAKTAARIILELKDKLSSLSVEAPTLTASIPEAAAHSSSSELSDAIEALSAIGYTRSEIMTALRGVDTSKMSLEEIFKAATKKLMK